MKRKTLYINKNYFPVLDGTIYFPPGFLLCYTQFPFCIRIQVQKHAILPSTTFRLPILRAQSVLPANHRLRQILHFQLQFTRSPRNYASPRVKTPLQLLQRHFSDLARFPHHIDVPAKMRRCVGWNDAVQKGAEAKELLDDVLPEVLERLPILLFGILRVRAERWSRHPDRSTHLHYHHSGSLLREVGTYSKNHHNCWDRRG